ncbi:Hypothetical predicted protein [Marmota monax]|uniref:Uncharacterized protein n=1 Tax=Marmota monax TaxID=9995 RepID=A0A5E4CPY8_MARMO|nr:Hypothetical predicted protein [Marmota monax]
MSKAPECLGGREGQYEKRTADIPRVRPGEDAFAGRQVSHRQQGPCPCGASTWRGNSIAIRSSEGPRSLWPERGQRFLLNGVAVPSIRSQPHPDPTHSQSAQTQGQQRGQCPAGALPWGPASLQGEELGAAVLGPGTLDLSRLPL